MGGAQALAELHGAGRMDVRQRIAGLLDPHSFQEMGCIAGKGHENYQIIGKETKSFDDRQVAKKALREQGY